MASRKRTELLENPPDLGKWLTRLEACKTLGVSVRTLQRMQDRGDVGPIQDERGAWRYDPDELDSIKEIEREVTIQDVLASSVKLAEQAQNYAEAFGKLVLPNAGKLIDSLMAELEDVRERAGARIAQLEQRLEEAFEAREKAINQAFERELAKLELEQQMKLKEQALTLLQEVVVPKIVNQIGATGHATKVVRGLEPEVLAVIKLNVKPEVWDSLQKLMTPEQEFALQAALQKEGLIPEQSSTSGNAANG